MVLVISIANLKGGTGKTTLAILLASEYATEQKVALIDASETKDLFHIMKRQAAENNKNPNIKVYGGSAKKDIPALLKKIQQEYEIIIIDMPSHLSAQHDHYFINSSLVFIPTTIGEQEAMKIRDLNQHLDQLKSNNKLSKNILRVIAFNRVNMTHKNSPIFMSQKAMLKSLNYSVLETQISDRITYSFVTSSMGDLHSLEDKTSTKIISAKKNIQDLCYDIEQFLKIYQLKHY